MYTILINNDNSLESSIRQRILHRENLVNELHFLADPIYKSGTKEFDMSNFTCTLEYVLPISKKYIVEVLRCSEDLYDEKLEYLLPINTKITSEPGKIQLKLTFTWLELDADGNTNEYVRKTTSTILKVIPTEMWSDYIASTDLDSISQIMLELQGKIDQEQAIVNQMIENQVDDLIITDDNILHVSAGGRPLGEGADVAITKPDIYDDNPSDNIFDLDSIKTLEDSDEPLIPPSEEDKDPDKFLDLDEVIHYSI